MTDRPNVLLFLVDGMQAAAALPGSPCLTPHLDRLAARGIRFDRATCSTPTCSPSRASLLTGLLPHNHGVLEVEHGRDPDQCVLRSEKPHFAQRLTESGYRTAYFGKWHVEREHRLREYGWQINGAKSAEHVKHLGRGAGEADPNLDPERSRWIEGPVPGYRKILHYGVTETPVEQRYPAATVDQALSCLESRDSSIPWACTVSFSEPNEALIASREFFDRYDLADIDLPANRFDEFVGKPNLYRRVARATEGTTDEQWRMARACYYSRISELDDQLGRLLDWLEDSEHAENTLVIFTSDHGRYVGAHGYDAHNFGAFEEIYRIPLVVAGAGVEENVASSARVQLGDLCPTILEMTGAAPIEETDFRSVVPLLKEGSGEVEEDFQEAYGEYHGTRFPLCQRILWEGDWKFVFNGFDEDELYDLQSDPEESRNLASLSEHRDRIEKMMQNIWHRARTSGDRTLLESHYLSMRFAAVGPDMDP